jgi:hypothetical protein
LKRATSALSDLRQPVGRRPPFDDELARWLSPAQAFHNLSLGESESVARPAAGALLLF